MTGVRVSRSLASSQARMSRSLSSSPVLHLLLLLLLFITANLYLLSLLEQRLAMAWGAPVNCSHQLQQVTEKKDLEKESVYLEEKNRDGKLKNKYVEEKKTYVEEEKTVQVISLEEDGRMGNLLMEAATLLLVGRQASRKVSLLPQVAAKLAPLMSPLPLPTVDSSKHCLCTKCTDCLCKVCRKWKKVPYWKYLANPAQYQAEPYLLIQWFHSDLVLKHLKEVVGEWRPLLDQARVGGLQEYLHTLKGQVPGGEPIFVGIHVRRTDYLKWVEGRYSGHPVDQNFFLHCMAEFRKKLGSSVLFLVTSDDLPWCRSQLGASDVVFPDLGPRLGDPPVTDFLLTTQMNHSIYDYGSFGFWGAALAGGTVMLADGYSEKLHPILAAIRKLPPTGWQRIDVSKLKTEPTRVQVTKLER